MGVKTHHQPYSYHTYIGLHLPSKLTIGLFWTVLAFRLRIYAFFGPDNGVVYQNKKWGMGLVLRCPHVWCKWLHFLRRAITDLLSRSLLLSNMSWRLGTFQVRVKTHNDHFSTFWFFINIFRIIGLAVQPRVVSEGLYCFSRDFGQRGTYVEVVCLSRSFCSKSFAIL